jgi:hypothetical protein
VGAGNHGIAVCRELRAVEVGVGIKEHGEIIGDWGIDDRRLKAKGDYELRRSSSIQKFQLRQRRRLLLPCGL